MFKTKCGRVHLAVFEQSTATGQMLSITMKRTYREGNEFKDAYSFSPGDLDDIERLIGDVRGWVKSRQQQEA